MPSRPSTALGHSPFALVFLGLLVYVMAALEGCRTAEPARPDPPSTDAAKEADGRVPLTAFASLPRVSDMALSPSGDYLAFIENVDGMTYLVTATYEGKEGRRLLESDNKKLKIRGFYWVNDERLLVSLSIADVRFGRGRLFKWTQTRLLAVNRDGADLKTDLIRLESDLGFFPGDHMPQLQDRILGKTPDDDRSVLIALDLSSPTYPDVYKLDVYTGQRELIERSIHGVRSWLLDRQGVVRVGVAVEKTMIRIMVKPPGQDSWHTLKQFDASVEPGLVPLGFDEDPHCLYVSQYLDGRAAVYRINISKPEEPAVVIMSHSEYDTNGNMIYFPWFKQVVGIRNLGMDARAVYWHAEAQRLQRRIDRVLPRRFNMLRSSSEDGRRHVVESIHATQPRQWYLVDDGQNRIRLIATDYPDLDPRALIEKTPITFTARDGTVLHGFVTRPAQERRPLVVLPHGGPAARDGRHFDYWSQFFVSRGWAVLQVNFRGSRGYGLKHLEAGFKQWGLEMQDDLTDGVQFAIEQGIADPERICIVGGGYGGYAALMGIVKTPNLYRCAVSLAGPSDLIGFLKQQRPYLHYELGSERQLGSWWSDRHRLKATSPITYADKIRTSLLLVHGAEDQVVLVEHSREMAEALKDAGFEDFRYVELSDGDHHLSRQEDRIAFFREMERFLTRHLDGPGTVSSGPVSQ